jgi:hypothetical protein
MLFSWRLDYVLMRLWAITRTLLLKLETISSTEWRISVHGLDPMALRQDQFRSF